MKVNINNLLFYSLLWTIFHLSGNYFGGYFNLINYFLSIVFILNVVHLLLSRKFLYYNQTFSTYHPQKDETIEYSYYLKNSLPFISSPIYMSFTDLTNIDSKKVVLGGNNKFIFKSHFKLPYRGVYSVGYKEMEITDILNILILRKKLYQRTFYVYPKVTAQYLTGHGKGKVSTHILDSSGKNKDSFQSIDSYKPGSKSSVISWKHFALTGTPYVKQFASIENKAISVFIDRTKLSHKRKGPADDKTMETVVSIVNNSIKNGEECFLSNKKLIINSYGVFNDYYKSTVFEEFNYTKKEVKQEFNNINFGLEDNIVIVSPLENSYFLKKELFIKFPKLVLLIIKKSMSLEKINSIKTHIDSLAVNWDRIKWIE